MVTRSNHSSIDSENEVAGVAPDGLQNREQQQQKQHRQLQDCSMAAQQ
jgi:hypothetical protein